MLPCKMILVHKITRMENEGGGRYHDDLQNVLKAINGNEQKVRDICNRWGFDVFDEYILDYYLLYRDKQKSLFYHHMINACCEYWPKLVDSFKNNSRYEIDSDTQGGYWYCISYRLEGRKFRDLEEFKAVVLMALSKVRY